MIEEEPDRTTEPELREVLAELRRREPVFHGPSWRSLADFDDAERVHPPHRHWHSSSST